MISEIGSGLILGIIHVLTGPDHFIAIIPSSFSRPEIALRNSLSWAIGHSSGLMVFAIIALIIKDNANSALGIFSSYAELLVGITLIFFGLFAIKDSLGLRLHSHKHKHKDGVSHKHFHIHAYKNTNKHSHSLSGLGLLHGLGGWRHYVGIIPATTTDSLYKGIVYLISYLIGTILVMNFFMFILSISTLRVGTKLVKRLTGFAGFTSITLGLLIGWQEVNRYF